MSSLPADDHPSRDPETIASTDTATPARQSTNPLWLLIFGGALFFAFAAALLASG
jgi:hypothetical protein